MTGYLQRLIDTAAPHTETPPPSLSPVVRSSSPIFEQDQLLALGDIGDLHGGDQAEAPGAPAHFDAGGPIRGDAGMPASPPPSPDIPRTLETGDVPGLDEVGPSPASHPRMTPADRPLAAPDPAGDAVSPIPAPADPLHAADVPSAPRPLPPETGMAPAAPEAVGRAEKPLVRPQEPPRHDSRRAPKIVHEAAPRADTPFGPAVDDAPATTHDIASARSRAAREPARDQAGAASPQAAAIEVVPRPRRYEPDTDVEAPAQNRAEPTAPPRISIGRVTVEVVPEKTPDTPKPSPPATADAASVIGPLGDTRAARHLFALRRW